MKTFIHLLSVLILSVVLFACNNAHFLKEENYRNQVTEDFEQKKQALPHGDLFAVKEAITNLSDILFFRILTCLYMSRKP